MKDKTEAGKAEFIGKYLDRKMKGHGLPYGMAYLNMVAEMEDKAEKAWNIKVKKLNNKS